MTNIIQNKENDNWKYYYDAMECLEAGNDEEAEELLKEAIEIDEDFIAAYLGMVSVYRARGNQEKMDKYANLAFEKTKKKFPKWPREMLWGILENRQYLRAICGKAILCHEKNEKEKAEELYRLLLKLNPNDNQGVRYLLAALYAGKHPRVVDELIDEGNMLQDWSKLEKLLEEQNKKHKFWNSV